MDFLVGFLRSAGGHNARWVIVDRLTKFAHFLPVKMTFSLDQLARLYIKEIVGLHETPVSIVTIQTLKDMLRSYVLDQGGNRESKKRVLGPEIIERIFVAIDKIRTRKKAAQDRQKSYADIRRKDLEFQVGDKVFLKVVPIKGVLRVRSVAYRLALPLELSPVHNIFHILKIKKYMYDPDYVVNYQSLDVRKDLSYEQLPIKILNRKHHEPVSFKKRVVEAQTI
ncbi:uncharacterized protein LOC111406898 [Olea europaea var. sylvestris]|uniref:uncharacterized protein LOC111406898 n=1 Tax=Olea europaea var. sylvestris TaxID=158386 RepID=UPI000C1D1B74|nr:uncharacterized protein LOC111406898 [Olea europaea var. sylvestris]